MKRKIANKLKKGDCDFYNKRIDEDYFKGYACLLKLKNIDNPWIINDFGKDECILENDYKWLELYPDNEKYAITVMYDNNNNLIEWYFDMIKNSGTENGIPYIDDLYLDYIIKEDGKEVILDENELEEALNSNDITKEDFDMAYKTMEYVRQKYRGNLELLQDVTKKIYKEFTI